MYHCQHGLAKLANKSMTMSLMVVGGLESGGGLITVADESMSGHLCVITSLIPAPTPPEGGQS